MAPRLPCCASRSTYGPPGYGRSSRRPTLSKASPAASSRVEPSSTTPVAMSVTESNEVCPPETTRAMKDGGNGPWTSSSTATWPITWLTPYTGLPVATASAFAPAVPTVSESMSPGPAATAIASTSSSVTSAAARAALSVGTNASRWAREAISGTMPPYRANSSMDVAVTSASRVRPRTSATPVSSQVDSIPSTSGSDTGASVDVSATPEPRPRQVAVELADDVERDLLRAHGGALADVLAPAESLGVVAVQHGHHAGLTFGLALREHAEVGDLRRREQHRGRVGTRRHAGTAPDAGRRLERALSVGFRHRHRVGVRGGARVHRDVAAGLDDAVERAAVHHEVLDDREGLGAPRLHRDGVAVLEAAQVQLTGGGALRSVCHAVDHAVSYAADPLATVGVERHRLLAPREEFFVEDVQHLELSLIHISEPTRL